LRRFSKSLRREAALYTDILDKAWERRGWQPLKSGMKLFPILFWSLVLATALVSYRWGSMVGLVFCIALLMKAGPPARSARRPPTGALSDESIAAATPHPRIVGHPASYFGAVYSP
jgi:hypothetical protein